MKRWDGTTGQILRGAIFARWTRPVNVQGVCPVVQWDLSRRLVPFVPFILLPLQTPFKTINQMPKTKPLQGDQLALDELLLDATKTDYKPVKKALKKQALYRVRKD